MKESYEKGVAIHLGPELCGVSREAGHEALVGVRAGRVLSPESTQLWGADVVPSCGRPRPDHRQREMAGTPRGRRPRACTETLRTRTGRSQVFSSDSAGRAQERSGKLEDARR